MDTAATVTAARGSAMKHIVVFLFAALAAGCGNDSPTGPTGQSVVDAAGVWQYTARLSSVAGGECVGADFQAAIGQILTGTLSVTQNGANLTATSRDNATGSSCQYTGTAGRNSIALGWTSCDIGNLSWNCANGARRDLFMITNSVNATINGRSASGTQAESYNVVVGGIGTQVGVLTLNASFTASR